LRVLMWTVGLSIFSPAGASKKEAALKVILHPSMIAVYLGLMLMSFQLSLPLFVEKTLSSIGGCTTALSMMLIGALLAETERKHLKIDRNLLLFSFLRLVVIPLVSLLAGRLLGVEPLIIGVSVILGAMPGGSSTVILAAKYGSDTVFTSKLVIVSTILSMLSIPIWCLVL
ncbi:MAG: AEC family transporter, partial [Sphaerochaeta sp.]